MRDRSLASDGSLPPPSSVDDAIRHAVADAVREVVAGLVSAVRLGEKAALSAADTARLLSISTERVRQLVADGRLVRLADTGNRVVIPRWSIDAYVVSGNGTEPLDPGHARRLRVAEEAPDDVIASLIEAGVA